MPSQMIGLSDEEPNRLLSRASVDRDRAARRAPRELNEAALVCEVDALRAVVQFGL
jgi:hypothetical protein